MGSHGNTEDPCSTRRTWSLARAQRCARSRGNSLRPRRDTGRARRGDVRRTVPTRPADSIPSTRRRRRARGRNVSSHPRAGIDAHRSRDEILTPLARASAAGVDDSVRSAGERDGTRARSTRYRSPTTERQASACSHGHSRLTRSRRPPRRVGAHTSQGARRCQCATTLRHLAADRHDGARSAALGLLSAASARRLTGPLLLS